MSCCKKCPYTDKNCVHSLPICKAYEKEYKPLTDIRCKIEVRNEENKIHQTNADRIRSFSDDELAEFIEQVSTDSMETISFGTKKYEEIWEHKETALQWLQSEVEA